jgi:DNA-binding HxlR family transcriptional regulator
VRGYAQYCPIARAAEILAERWTPIIVRNLLLGCTTFTEIEKGAPGIPKTLLVQRLKLLESVGIVQRRPNPRGRGAVYSMSSAGQELWDVCIALGNWGARWLEMAPEHLDPYVVLWSMSNYSNLNRDRVPDHRVVVRFEFPDLRRNNRLWLVLDNGNGEVCVRDPGFEENLVVTADSESLVNWYTGRIAWADAVGAGRILVEGAPRFVRSFPTWYKLSAFAHIRPARESAGAETE